MAQGAETNRRPQILHLEDDPLDVELVREMLRGAGVECAIRAVSTRSEFEDALREQDWDVVLSDFSLPAFDGAAALEIAQGLRPATPFVFVSGTLGEDNAVECIKRGATDYVLKKSLSRLVPAVTCALKDRAEMLRRMEAEAELQEAQERLQFLAYHDDLTGLANRALLRERLSEIVAESRRHGTRAAILLIDLDEFKLINDSLGHSAGDLVLQTVGKRIQEGSRGEDIVARVGGDEFVVVLRKITDYTDAAMAVERVREVVAEEMDLADYGHMRITCSIGITIFPESGSDGETLMRNADAALYAAKNQGRNAWRFFRDDLNRRALEQLTLQNELRGALKRGELSLVYQPQAELTTGRLVGAEALLRWENPKLGMVPPSTFIPCAERTGEIWPIGQWVLETACRQAKEWEEAGTPLPLIAVNVSAVQFGQPEFLDTVRRALDDAGLAPEHLELEITETRLMESSEKLAPVFRSLKEMGVRLAIDDFGTGYCGLNYLRAFPFSRLKIDREFVASIQTDPRTAALTKAVVHLVEDLRMRIIAECVETIEQASLLQALGCHEIQGYLFGRPVTAPVFEASFLRRSGGPLLPASPRQKGDG